MQIIGLSGYARTGKDEFAAVLVNEYNFIRIAYADKLREVLYALDPIVAHENLYGIRQNRLEQLQPVTVSQVIDRYGWDGYKETKYKDEIRRLLQRLGTEAGRKALWDSIWVDAAFANLNPDSRVVITDMRFPNEAQAVKDRGGVTLRIDREGVGPINNHASETSLDDWKFDWRVQNTGSLEEYQESVRQFMEFTS